MNDVPQFTVAWEPRWKGFLDSLPILLKGAPGPLLPEYSKPRYRSFAASFLLHIVIVTLTFSIWTSGWINNDLRVRPPDYSHVIYYRAGDLPQVNDVGGAQEGSSGTRGGREAFHPRQTIHIARGPKLSDHIVDAPHLNLPNTNEPVANLLALGGPVAPSAPADRLRRSLRQNLLNDNAMPVAPPPANLARNLGSVPKLELPASLVHPAPQNTRRRPSQATLDALAPDVVQPAADNVARNIAQAHLDAPVVNVVQPAPQNMARILAQAQVTSLPMNVVQPAPGNVVRSVAQAKIDGLPSGIVQPAPENTNRVLAESHLSVPVGVVQPEAGNTIRSLAQFLGLSGGSKGGGIAPPFTVASGGSGSGGSGSPAQGMANGNGRSGSQNAPGEQSAGRGSGSGSVLPGGGSRTEAHGPSAGSGNSALEPGAGGNGGPMGIIASLHPGSNIGMPPEQILGAMAMSPNGGAQNGLGGSGTGTGIAKGGGAGSGTSGAGPGGGKAGAGLGADPAAHGGSSPSPGPGGAGNADSGIQMAGISVHGNVVSLPSFAVPGAAGLSPGLPSEPLGPRKTPPIIIVASPRAGGALNRYGFLKGARVYTVYMDTELGPAVLQYAEHSESPQGFREELTAPELQHAEYPAGASKLHLVVSCLIDRAGAVKDLHLLESSNSEMATKMLSALAKWRFRPVLRGEKAIDAEAIVGFGVDTR